jgi:hypothetical protein
MKSKIIYGATGLIFVLGLIFSASYYVKSEMLITGLSANQTQLNKDLDTVYGEYVKLIAPKVFKNEADLITWLKSNTGDTSLSGYMALAKSQGAFMQIWCGWVDGRTTISGIDFGETWQQTKGSVVGVKYALMTLVDKKTYLIDLETKRLIIVDLEAKSNGSW